MRLDYLKSVNEVIAEDGLAYDRFTGHQPVA